MLKKTITPLLVFILSLPATSLNLMAQTQQEKPQRIKIKAQKPKLSPDLTALLARDDEEQAQRRQGRTLADLRQERLARQSHLKTQNTPASTADDESARIIINGVALPSAEVGAEEKQSFIVQFSSTAPDVVMQEKIAALGGRISKKLAHIGLAVIEAPRQQFSV